MSNPVAEGKTALSFTRKRYLSMNSSNRRFATRMDTPVGNLLLVADDHHLREIRFLRDESAQGVWDEEWVFPEEHPLLESAVSQLWEYFHGQRRNFSLPLWQAGTVFQQRVWRALQQIPYGKVVSYQELARWIDRPKAVRAVGQANRKNKIPILVPCHRVIYRNGEVGGYAAGLEIKRRLLALEGVRL